MHPQSLVAYFCHARVRRLEYGSSVRINISVNHGSQYQDIEFVGSTFALVAAFLERADVRYNCGNCREKDMTSFQVVGEPSTVSSSMKLTFIQLVNSLAAALFLHSPCLALAGAYGRWFKQKDMKFFASADPKPNRLGESSSSSWTLKYFTSPYFEILLKYFKNPSKLIFGSNLVAAQAIHPWVNKLLIAMCFINMILFGCCTTEKDIILLRCWNLCCSLSCWKLCCLLIWKQKFYNRLPARFVGAQRHRGVRRKHHGIVFAHMLHATCL